MRFAITGASGLIGSELIRALRGRGDRVTRLVRSREAARAEDAVYWNPAARAIDTVRLEDHDVVVHLAGENVFGLWTAAKKRRLWESRVAGTRLLASALATLRNRPVVLISASGVGIYGDRGDAWLDERAETGTGFLAELGRAWESATEPAAAAGLRVVTLRQGIVLSPRGGALRIMTPIFRAGMGGPIGRGGQYTPWIALPELPGIVRHVVEREALVGPVNAVAPRTPTFRELSEALAAAVGRRARLFVPARVARLVAGEMAQEMLLASARVVPARLLESDYSFHHPDLQVTLAALLRR